MKTILFLIAAGIISTIVMDLSGAVLRASGITAGVPPDLIGKWIHSAFRGQAFVDDIRTSPGDPVPMSRFLVYHYMIGILLAILFYLIISFIKITPHPWWVPVVYGLMTTLIPAFLMYPGMGFGTMGLKGPDEYLLMRTAILNHLFYGIGLMLAFRWLFKFDYTYYYSLPGK